MNKRIDDKANSINSVPTRYQVAALCVRRFKGKKQVLLVTSRGTGRWIIPKGWPMKGKTLAASAMEEAWEEAGVTQGQISQTPVGTYFYVKEPDAGSKDAPIPVVAEVFKIKVKEMQDAFPEAKQRSRAWVTPKEAARRVQEPELKEILKKLKP